MIAGLSARQDHLIKLVYIQHWSDALQELQFPILFIRGTVAIVDSDDNAAFATLEM